MGSQVRVLLRPLRAEPKGTARFLYRDDEHREPSPRVLRQLQQLTNFLPARYLFRASVFLSCHIKTSIAVSLFYTALEVYTRFGMVSHFQHVGHLLLLFSFYEINWRYVYSYNHTLFWVSYVCAKYCYTLSFASVIVPFLMWNGILLWMQKSVTSAAQSL